MKLLGGWTVGSDGQHLRFKLNDGRATWTAMAFRQGNGEVPQSKELDLGYTLSTSSWRGERVLILKVLDFRPSEG
jgi:hypothetical protein